MLCTWKSFSVLLKPVCKAKRTCLTIQICTHLYQEIKYKCTTDTQMCACMSVCCSFPNTCHITVINKIQKVVYKCYWLCANLVMNPSSPLMDPRGTVASLKFCSVFNTKRYCHARKLCYHQLETPGASWIYNPHSVNIYWLMPIMREIFSTSLKVVLPRVIWYCWFATILTKKGQFHMV